MTTSDLLDSQVRYHVLENLDENSKYWITVDAVTSKGSLNSTGVNATTLEDGR